MTNKGVPQQATTTPTLAITSLAQGTHFRLAQRMAFL